MAPCAVPFEREKTDVVTSGNLWMPEGAGHSVDRPEPSPTGVAYAVPITFRDGYRVQYIA